MDRYKAGRKVRAEVLGEEHVARSEKSTGIDKEFVRYITETVWGTVWTRPGLERRTRILVTIAILAALGRDELRLHLRSTKRTGVTREEIFEVLLHVSAYAGVPAANHALAIAKEELPAVAKRGTKARTKAR